MTDKAIPARPSLEFDRKQAKRLLKGARNGDREATARFAASHPRYPDAESVDPADIALSDACLVVAREYGFSSWPAWKRFVELGALDASAKGRTFLESVCSNQVGVAAQLLRLDEAISSQNACTAAAAGNLVALTALLERDPASITRRDGPLDAEPLVYACQSRLLATDPTRRENIVECARLLLEAGANPNAAFSAEGSDQPRTALYGAAGIANHPVLTRLLLEAGADPNDGVKGRAGETLYHVAEFVDTSCLSLVLAAKPDKDALDFCLGRALDFRQPDAAMLFVAHGADVEFRVPWFDNQTHLMKAIKSHADFGLIKAMVERASDLDKADDHGFTAYRHAVRAGRSDVAALLESRGADVSSVTLVDRALGACVAGDEVALDALLVATPELSERLSDLDKELLPGSVRRTDRGVIRLFVKLGIPVDFGSQMPALHEACYCGDFEAVELLVGLGASLTRTNIHGSNALGVAIHGSMHCHDPWGGPGSRPPETIAPRDYARIVDYLVVQGSPLPERETGSPAVIEALQRCRIS